MMRARLVMIALLLCGATGAVAQTVYLDVHHPVYAFLDRVEARYMLGMPSFVRPLSRMDVALQLDRLRRSSIALHPHDAAELAWHAQEFAAEAWMAGDSASASAGGRWHLYDLAVEGVPRGYIAADFVAGASYERRDDAADVVQRHAGVRVSGMLSDAIGFGLLWTDNGRRGEPYDARAWRTPAQGVVKGPGAGTSYEYEVAEGQLTWSRPWIRVGINKLDRWMGSGRVGSIVLSDKAPSFPALVLHLRLTDWFHFDYAHGWLFSDSLDLDRTQPEYAGFERQKIYHGKYFATHALTVRPSDRLQIALGESIIYSDQLNPLFLLPVISFRAADRWSRASTGNAQFFADVRGVPMRGLLLYGTGYIDELDASKIFSSDGRGFDYHVAYTVGALATDLLAALLPLASETRVEFTRTYPYVYTNPKITQQYSSHGVLLGHWIGANADLLHVEHAVHLHRSLRAALQLTMFRAGEGRAFLDLANRVQPAFLYDHEYTYTRAGLRIDWEPLHDLRVFIDAAHARLTRMPGFTGSALPEGFTLGAGASYGIFQ